MATFDPAAYIEVADRNGSFFTDTIDGDLTFYTGTPGQRVLFGTQPDTPSLLALDASTFTASRNAVFQSNMLIDGALSLARPIVLAGLQIGRSPLPGAPLNLSVQPPFAAVTGLVNDAAGMQLLVPSSNQLTSFRFLAVSNVPSTGFVSAELARLTETGLLGVGTAAPTERLSIGASVGLDGTVVPAALSLTGAGGRVVLTTGGSNLGVGFPAGAGASLTALLHVNGTARFDGVVSACNGLVAAWFSNPGPGGAWAANLAATFLATPACSNGAPGGPGGPGAATSLFVAQLSNATTLWSPTVAFGGALAGPGLAAGPTSGVGGAAGAQTASLCNAGAAFLGAGDVRLGPAAPLTVPAGGLAACNGALYTAAHSNSGGLYSGSVATPSLSAGAATFSGAVTLGGALATASLANAGVVTTATLAASALVSSPYVSCATLSNSGALQAGAVVTPGFSNGGPGGATLFSGTHSNSGALYTATLGAAAAYTSALSNAGALSTAALVVTATLATPAASNAPGGGTVLYTGVLCNAATMSCAGAFAFGAQLVGPGLVSGPIAGPGGAAGVQVGSLSNGGAAFVGGPALLAGPVTATAGALAACNAALYTTTLSNAGNASVGGALAVAGVLSAAGGLATPAGSGLVLTSPAAGGGTVTLAAAGAPAALTIGVAGLLAASVTARSYDTLLAAPHAPLSAANAPAFKAWLARETSTSNSWWAGSASPSYGVVSTAVYNAATATSNAYGGAVLLPDGSVLMVPGRATSITIFVPATNQLNMLTGQVDPPGGAHAAYGGGALLPDSRVVFCPRYATSVGIFRPASSNGFSALAVAPGLLAGNDDYHGCVLVPDGRVVFSPVNATRVATLTTSGGVDAFAQVASSTGVDPAGGGAYRGCVLLADGRVVLVPHNATNVGVFDPTTNGFSVAAAGGPPGGGAFFGGALLPDGRVAFAPHNATGVGLFDPATGAFSTAAAGAAPGGRAYCGAALLASGSVVFTPFAATTVGIFVPATGAFSATTACAPYTGSFSGSALLPDGRVLFVPCTSLNVGVLNTFVPAAHALCYHPCFNRF